MPSMLRSSCILPRLMPNVTKIVSYQSHVVFFDTLIDQVNPWKLSLHCFENSFAQSEFSAMGASYTTSTTSGRVQHRPPNCY